MELMENCCNSVCNSYQNIEERWNSSLDLKISVTVVSFIFELHKVLVFIGIARSRGNQLQCCKETTLPFPYLPD